MEIQMLLYRGKAIRQTGLSRERLESKKGAYQMKKIKIIPCLDIKDGRVVKGVNFVNLIDAGDPAQCAEAYERAGANEIVMLDIAATPEGRKTRTEMIERAAGAVSIPVTVGGGISTLEDMERVFEAGADKISINSAAVREPQLITRAAEKFGSAKITVAIDAKKSGAGWKVCTAGGEEMTGREAADWAQEAERLGAGAILLTSMDCDGTLAGYDLGLTRSVSERVSLPVIASGGAGKLEHFYDAAAKGGADAVLAASLFHFGTVTIPELRKYLEERGIEVEPQ
jgi:cyclase